MSRNKKGNELRKVVSIRMQPSDKEKIKLIFGSVQVWIDQCLEVLNKTKAVKNEKDSSN